MQQVAGPQIETGDAVRGSMYKRYADLGGGSRKLQSSDFICKCSELRDGINGGQQYAAAEQQKRLRHGSYIFKQVCAVLKVGVSQPVEQIDCHSACSDVGEKHFSGRNQQQPRESHGKSYGVAEGAPEDSGKDVLPEKVIVVPPVKYFYGKDAEYRDAQDASGKNCDGCGGEETE